jgi:hypothetical protein
MRASRIETIEATAGVAAAASLAGAFGFAGYRLADGLTDTAGMVAVASVSTIVGFIAGRSLLKVLAGAPKPFAQPIFDIVEVEPVEHDELLLTDHDRLRPADDAEALELDDILVEIAPNSRVVQLFDRSAMPTPGQLKERIDRHLDGGTSHSPSPDASEALFAALADLRRSLR